MGVVSSVIVQVIMGANEATIQTLFVMACCVSSVPQVCSLKQLLSMHWVHLVFNLVSKHCDLT